MPTQVQIRGTTQATQEGRTLVTRELDVNTTDNRLAVHNGSTAGGVPIPNWIDTQNQEYTYAAASGTNTITASYNKNPTAYATGQRFTFKAAATNTGSATLNINSLGAITIKKKDTASGTITTLSAGDIISGGIYTVFYDSTDFILEAVDGGGITSVSQGDLNTSSGIVSTTSTSDFLTLPGGAYGFYPQFRYTGSSGQDVYAIPVGEASAGDLIDADASDISTSYVTRITLGSSNGVTTMYAQQRYITSSPPFDLGDGEMMGFVYAKVNKSGDVLSTYIADVPPWAYNGPTRITCDYQCPVSGKKYKYEPEKLTAKDIIDGKQPKINKVEITQSIKNADIDIAPHPFALRKDESVVLLDPMDERIRNVINYQNSGGDIDFNELLTSGRIRLDNEGLKRKGPKSVQNCKFYL